MSTQPPNPPSWDPPSWDQSTPSEASRSWDFSSEQPSYPAGQAPGQPSSGKPGGAKNLLIALACLLALVVAGAGILIHLITRDTAQLTSNSPSTSPSSSSSSSSTFEATGSSTTETSTETSTTSRTSTSTGSAPQQSGSPLAPGDCVTLEDAGDGRVAYATSPCTVEPSFTVMVVHDAEGTCPKIEAHFNLTINGQRYLYCLAENVTVGKCYQNSTTGKLGYHRVTCTDQLPQVTLTVNGVADASRCAAGERARVFPDGPKRTTCLTG